MQRPGCSQPRDSPADNRNFFWHGCARFTRDFYRSPSAISSREIRYQTRHRLRGNYTQWHLNDCNLCRQHLELVIILDTREQKGDNAVNSSRDLSPPLLINLRQT